MDSLKRVIDFSIEQAKYYLERAGEFYPFGTIEHFDGQLQPVGVNAEEDYPDPKEIVSYLTKSIVERVMQKKMKTGAIGTDVSISLPGFENMVSAVEIKAIDEQGNTLNCYLPYLIAEGRPFFRDVISESGTLSF